MTTQQTTEVTREYISHKQWKAREALRKAGLVGNDGSGDPAIVDLLYITAQLASGKMSVKGPVRR